MKPVDVNGIRFGGGAPFVLIAGPCVIEEEKRTRDIARFLRDLTGELGIPFVFKASYDKANRSARGSYRGPGLTEGLRILAAIRRDFGCPVLSDVHRFEEIDEAAAVLDIMQIPAFLCRQTDFVMEIARKARVVNIKKGQFLAPWDVANVVEKVQAAGNERILVTERGASFGYNNLVADFRALPLIRALGYPVIFDATHSVQLPGGLGTASGGQREMVPFLARAAAGAGLDGIFMEVHPDPDRALCDGPNSLALGRLQSLLAVLREIDHIVKRSMGTEDGNA
ncbi:MAG: 3-deoxy-8-phosphooctulonate synthase [Syntrophaceae bacterium]|nr:3-deoxy-8-phosphooctulonate synthase [Syntrophaceae bacterium]